MILKELLNGVDVKDKINYCDDICINSLLINSNEIKQSSIFFCIKGEKIDSHLLFKDAIKNGANVLVVQKYVDSEICQILVDDCRKALFQIAKNFYYKVDEKLKLIGVTGTNGKTSITFMFKHLFENEGIKVGIIGTNGAYIGNRKIETKLTTPDVLDLFEIFKTMVESKVEFCIMEVSAHAIYLSKVCGLNFEYGILTNITQDHLDFFQTMENYANVKLDFLKQCKKAIINIDDKYGKCYVKNNNNAISYSIHNKSDYKAYNVKKMHKNVFTICDKMGNNYVIKTNMVGKHNIYNNLAVLAFISDYYGTLSNFQNSFIDMPTIKGRLDLIEKENYNIVIDFAHTPDAMEKVLYTLSKMTKDLIVVFGSAGNRDFLKRREMGEIASKYASYVILTSDNPRYENIKDICCDLCKNIIKPYSFIEKRSEAIKFAKTLAKEKTIIAILGKGAEDYQDIMAIKVPYSDYDYLN